MKTKYILAFLAFSIFGLTPLALYFYHFYGGISIYHTSWAEFGTFYGGVLGPAAAVLAFIALLWNLEVTMKQFKRQSEENQFFNLLELHNNKVKGITYNGIRNTHYTGFEAFKKYVEEFNNLYDTNAILVARNEMSKNTRNLTYNAYDFLWEKLSHFLHDNDKVYGGDNQKKDKIISFFENSTDRWELQKGLIGTDDHLSMEDRDKLIAIGHVIIEDSKPKFRVEIIQYVNDLFYQNYGHMLGHYFRNIYYILKFIDESEKSIEYSKLFCAQLSRYELTSLYYNALGNLSSTEFIELLIKYDIFNGIYSSDLCYFADREKIKTDLSSRLKDFS